MSIRDAVQRLLGSDEGTGSKDEDVQEEQRGEPSHVCQSCGEEYYTREDLEIQTCRECGGIKVEPTTA